MPNFGKRFVSFQLLLGDLKVNYPVYLESCFHKILVVNYACLNINYLNKCLKHLFLIRDSVKNYVHHEKNQPHQEVKYGYVFVNIVVKTT